MGNKINEAFAQKENRKNRPKKIFFEVISQIIE